MGVFVFVSHPEELLEHHSGVSPDMDVGCLVGELWVCVCVCVSPGKKSQKLMPKR